MKDASEQTNDAGGNGEMKPALAHIAEKIRSLPERLKSGSDARQPASFGQAFKHGLLCGFAFLLLLGAWMQMRGDDTAAKIQELIPVQTLAITKKDMPAQAEKKPEPAPAVKDTQPAQDPALPATSLAASKSVHALRPAPIEGLIENYEGLQIPKFSIDDDLTPFAAYKKPFEHDGTSALVSVVIVNYGLSGMIAQSILGNMPENISLVLSPYAAEATKWAAAARSYGHEFWLSLPMQTESFGDEDAGPLSIRVNAQPMENQTRLFDVMSSVAGYAGIVTQKNHAFTSDAAAIQPVLKQIFGRGLALVESTPDKPALGLSMAMEFGYPYVQNNFWLDEQTSPEGVRTALAALEEQAKRKGKAVAFIHPYPVLLQEVSKWAAEAPSKGLQIAPLSAMVSQ
ncbi:MAG: hypothetical protein DI626_08725 [Micavibrio aeruginosavorus]|uniref:Divergent polysaccharide deacetylase family protein n=1 Tax=Micavibrio aeruginosavorus TaxID=349221 RepID=A0A2W4ZQP7_9BACT|nr:MAG: hypothetical protein DI626_08725 [Micavibrio aeruginosavorus]